MARLILRPAVLVLVASATSALAQQQCYYGPGAEFRGPTNLVPCMESGVSACCLLGDTCLSGNTCFNYATGDLYQYGCNDITYTDASCPYKCGFNATLSPWTALEFCTGVPSIDDTWVCHAPESCGCQWNATYDLLHLTQIGCSDMGSNARVGLYAPSNLAPYVSLPSTFGGKTLYYSGTTISGTSTWISTALKGYTPSSIGPLTTYETPAPTDVVQLFPNKSPAPYTLPAAVSLSATVTPEPNGVWPGVGSAATSSSTRSSTRSSSSSSNTSPSVETVTTTSSPSPAPGLSIGAKAGIGAGVAIGVVGVAAAAGIFFCLRRRRNKQQPVDTSGQYPEKSAEWRNYSNHPLPGALPEGYYGHHGVPAVIHEAGASPMEEYQVRKALSPPPQELQAEHDVPEMESMLRGSSNTPAPPYGGDENPRDK